ncbi:hypothetical protein DXY21_01052 [Bacillus velezensis]|nr:hypothetical protein DXY21_01052 [Bacillus velezensis]
MKFKNLFLKLKVKEEETIKFFFMLVDYCE